VTPVSTVKTAAVPHLGDVALRPLDEFRKWAEMAISTLRELRKTFAEPGDLVWRAAAAELLEQRGLDAPSVIARLKARLASAYLTPIG
jgi:hypothetical protein